MLCHKKNADMGLIDNEKLEKKWTFFYAATELVSIRTKISDGEKWRARRSKLFH